MYSLTMGASSVIKWKCSTVGVFMGGPDQLLFDSAMLLFCEPTMHKI